MFCPRHGLHLHLLPAGLLALLIAATAAVVPALAAADLSTPNDPFRDVAKLAQRPPAPPVCCLKPLEPSGPAEEILSFEDWKARRELAPVPQQEQQHHQQYQQERRRQQRLLAEGDGADAPRAQSAEPPADTLHDGEDAGTEAPPPPPAPQDRVPLTDRFNYASVDCSARVHAAHRSARSPAALLSSKKDRYMLSPCVPPDGGSAYVVVELCEDVRIDTVQLANFEFFSGVFREFSVSVARTYSTDPAEWTQAGMYMAKNVRGIQSFHPPTSLRDFYRFIRIDFHSHFGNEYYCPVSLLRVYGLTHLEQWKWDEWQARRGEVEDAALAAQPLVYGDVVQVLEGEGAGSAAEGDVPAETADASGMPTTLGKAVGKEVTLTNMGSRSPTSPSSTANNTPISTHNSDSPSHDDPRSDVVSISLPTLGSGSSAVSSPSQSESASLGSASSLSDSPHSDPPASSTQSSGLLASSPKSISHAPSPSVVPTIVPHEARSVPAVTSSGESIYRTIMTRLSLLEGNSTLILRYVEEQARGMRDALMRLEEDVGRLEGIGKAHGQSLQRTVHDWEKQRRRLEREHGELLARVNYLADEVVLEKRLGIAQLCLLLTVLVFMALTRGSRGEPLIVPFVGAGSGGRRDSLREWGRRHLGGFSSGEWAAKLRNRSATPTPKGFIESPVPVKQIERVKFPTKRTGEASDGDGAIRRVNTSLVVPTPRARTPTGMRSAHPRQFVAHRPGTPTSAGFSAYGHGLSHGHAPRSPGFLATHVASGTSSGVGAGGGGAGRPNLRRMNSHNSPTAMAYTLSAGGTPVASVRRWAKSAHLHEIRKTGTRTGAGVGVLRNREEGKEGVKVQDAMATARRGLLTPRTSQEPDAGEADAVEGVHMFWPSTPPVPIPNSEPEPEPDSPGCDGWEGGSRGQAPSSVSALQNRSRNRTRADGQSTGLGRLGPSFQLGAGAADADAKVIDLDAESESWVDTDTDIEGSEFGD
ncbi:hypothetical protein M0805_004491 [Coniferiporia weirii]|nr:hypothetical protein M0805_004491 [Coniferiporia weirii]